MMRMQSKQDTLRSEDISHCAAYFRALGDPVRLLVIRYLQAGPLTVTDLAELLDLDLAKVSHHLRVLFKARLVDCNREGKFIYYRINGEFRHRAKDRLDLGCCQIDLTSRSVKLQSH
jgi:DNA-binding transcriptional ArsR family regulator